MIRTKKTGIFENIAVFLSAYKDSCYNRFSDIM